MDLSEACSFWQCGRDGSSRLRGAARVLTGLPHYFEAPYISEHETAARADARTLERGRVLLDAVASSVYMTGDEWCRYTELGATCFAGRGKQSEDVDDQISAALQKGEITMPLWGISLDRDVALGYGTRFIFELQGPFHGVAAWRESGEKSAQREVITGGRYDVVALADDAGTTRVTLRERELVWPPSAG